MVLISSSLIFTKVFVSFAYKNLMQFENNLLELIKNVKLKKIKNKFLDQLYKNVSYINKSENVFIFVDKTCNIHEIDTNTYSKLLMDNISKKRRVVYPTRSLKQLKLFRITIEFQKKFIVLENQT